MNPDPWPSITVVVVTYNNASVLCPTLEAVLVQDYPDFEVILVENASADESLAVAREFESRGLRIIVNPTNRGFSGGNNDGVRAGSGDIVFLLNPDAIMDPGTLREVTRAFNERPDIGIIGVRLVARDGKTIQHCGGAVGMSAHCELHGRGQRDVGQWNTPFEVEFVIGAILSNGGHSVTVLRSTAGGGKISRIAPTLENGTVVSIPRTFADYVVTEYGIASLWGKSQRERAEALISIAHPDFRQDLQKQAEELF